MVFSKSCNFLSRLGWTCRISIDLHCLGWGGRSRVFLLRRLHGGRRRGGRRRPRPAEQQALFEFEHFAGLEFLAGAHKKKDASQARCMVQLLRRRLERDCSAGARSLEHQSGESVVPTFLHPREPSERTMGAFD